MDRSLAEESADEPVGYMRFLLGFERLLIRMDGYPEHLEEINRAVFEGLVPLMREELGFSFAALPRVVSAIIDIGEERRALSIREAVESEKSPSIRSQTPDLSEAQRRVVSLSFVVFLISTRDACVDTLEISAKAEIPEKEVRAMLTLLSAEWGKYPKYRSPLELSPFREAPILSSPNGFSVPLPYSLLGDQFRLFEARTRDSCHAKLRERYLLSRDKATEEMGREVLGAIFDGIASCRRVEYEINGRWFECDGLVVIEPLALVLEAKASSLTEAGRRGAPGRLKKKVGELVEAPISQALRLSSGLVSGEARVRDRATKRSLEVRGIESILIVALTFERIDPLQHAWLDSLPDIKEARVWPICLADYLMVRDLVGRPSDFLAYSWVRSEVAVDRTLSTTMEADILGGFFRDRLRSFLALRSTGYEQIFLGYSAKEINDYFTQKALGEAPEKLDAGLPGELVFALVELMRCRSANWLNLLQLVYQREPTSWKPLRQLIKKVKRTGHARRLDLSDPALSVEVVPRPGPESSANRLVVDVSAPRILPSS